MKNSIEKTNLLEKITFLKKKKSEDLLALKFQYQETIQSLNPINIIKSATQEIILLPNIKSNFIKSAMGFGANYMTEKFLSKNSTNPIKRVLGKLLKIAIKNFIENESKKI